ncbi:unnamed protein product [Arctogadus glacialis]
MAPTITSAMNSSLEHLTHRPIVEKLRRERINSSIEQLKSLLGPEFLKQEPDSKMEKADILCVQEVVHFLSKDEVKTLSNRRMLDHFQNLRTSSDRLTEGGSIQLSSPLKNNITKEKSSVNSAVWRPW